MKKCPYCAEEIQDAAIKCKHCQSMLAASSNTPLKAKRQFVCVFLDGSVQRNKLYLEASDEKQINAYADERGWRLAEVEERTIPNATPIDISMQESFSLTNNSVIPVHTVPKSVQAKSSIGDGVRLGCGMFIALPLIILGIIGMITFLFIAIPNFTRPKVSIADKMMIDAMRTFSSAIESYRAGQAIPSYPSNISDLTSSIPPYLDTSWDLTSGKTKHEHSLQYRSSKDKFSLLAIPTKRSHITYCIDQTGSIVRSVDEGNVPIGTIDGCSGGSWL
jgi:hypothetical protein